MSYIDIHTHSAPGRHDVQAIVNQYPDNTDSSLPMFSVGLHPWYIKSETWEANLRQMEKLLNLRNCVAVGECGVDKKTETNLNLQMKVFEAQVVMAEKYQKPVIVHCVAAFQEVIAIKNRHSKNIPMILHGFSKGSQLAMQLIKHDFYLSFGKRLVSDESLRKVLKEIPGDRFFLETDSAEVAIEEVYKAAAESRGVDIASLTKQLDSNYNRILNQHNK